MVVMFDSEDKELVVCKGKCMFVLVPLFESDENELRVVEWGLGSGGGGGLEKVGVELESELGKG